MRRAYWRYLARHYGVLWFIHSPRLWGSPSAQMLFIVAEAHARLAEMLSQPTSTPPYLPWGLEERRQREAEAAEEATHGLEADHV